MLNLYSDSPEVYDIGLLKNEAIQIPEQDVKEVIREQTKILNERTRYVLYFLAALLIFILFRKK